MIFTVLFKQFPFRSFTNRSNIFKRSIRSFFFGKMGSFLIVPFVLGKEQSFHQERAQPYIYASDFYLQLVLSGFYLLDQEPYISSSCVFQVISYRLSTTCAIWVLSTRLGTLYIYQLCYLGSILQALSIYYLCYLGSIYQARNPMYKYVLLVPLCTQVP